MRFKVKDLMISIPSQQQPVGPVPLGGATAAGCDFLTKCTGCSVCSNCTYCSASCAPSWAFEENRVEGLPLLEVLLVNDLKDRTKMLG